MKKNYLLLMFCLVIGGEVLAQLNTTGYAGTYGVIWQDEFDKLGPKTTSEGALKFAFNNGSTIGAFTPELKITSAAYTNTRYVTNFPNTTSQGMVDLDDFGLNFGVTTLDNLVSKQYGPQERMVYPANFYYANNSYFNAGNGASLSWNNLYGFNSLVVTEGLNADKSSTSSATPYNFGTLTMSFSRPVDYPVIHITGLGGFFIGTTIPTVQYPVSQYLLSYTAELKSVDYDLTKLPVTTTTNVSLLADNRTITNNWVYNPSSTYQGTGGTEAGTGSFRIEGTNISEVNFTVYMRGKPTPGEVSHARWSTYDGPNPGGNNTIGNPDVLPSGPDFDNKQSYAGDQFHIGWTLPVYSINGSVVVTNTANTPGSALSGTAYTGGGLYALLVDDNGIIIRSQTVSASGTFSFQNVMGDSYKVLISTTPGTIGNTAPIETANFSFTSGTTSYSSNGQYFGNTTSTPTADPTVVNNSTEVFGVNYTNTANASPTLIFVLKPAGTTPVVLNKFSATASECKAVLNWNVEVEEAFGYYQVERSNDGVNFVSLGNVNAKGSRSNYTFIDSSPEKGNNYYRLKMVDKDGSFAYSEIKVANNACSKIKLNPTLTSADTKISGLSGKEIIRVYNSVGQMVVSKIAKTSLETISLVNLPSGTYHLVVTEGDQKIFSEKVIKN